jgi:hypothetical protein
MNDGCHALLGIVSHHSPFIVHHHHAAVNLEKYLVVGGVPGVHKLVTTRSNGLIIEDRNEGRTRFVPVRQHQMTPLGTISIYTDTEEGTIMLGEVFQKMLDQYGTNPPVPLSSSSPDFRAYFSEILPEHDQDRVHINDIKKCIKWFNFMHEKGIFEEIKRAEAEEAAAEAAENTAEADAPGTADAAETPAATTTTAAEEENA